MSIVRRSRRDRTFTIVDNQAINDPAMQMDELGVLTYLLSKPDDWTVSMKQLSNLNRGPKDSALRRIFKNLENLGYMQRTRVRRPDGTFRHETIVYDVPFSWKSPGHTTRELSTRGSATRGSSTSGSATRGSPPPIVKTDVQMTDVPNTDVVKTEGTNAQPQLFDDGKTEASVDSGEYTADFESFWSEYPRKIGKKATYAKWKATLKRGVAPERLILAAKNYAKQMRRDRTEEKFIKHPQTFLGPGAHYEDYFEVKINPMNSRDNVTEERLPETSSGEVSVEDLFGDDWNWDE